MSEVPAESGRHRDQSPVHVAVGQPDRALPMNERIGMSSVRSRCVGGWASTGLGGILILASCASFASAQPATVGLLVNSRAVQPGYVIVSPIQAKSTYLIDNNSHLVHSWTSTYTPSLWASLEPDGHLLRAGALAPNVDPNFRTAQGGGGILEEYDWDGNIVWSMTYSSASYLQHHDFKKLPNGNVMFLAWTYRTVAEATANGRTLAAAMWPDSVVEVQPTLPTGGTIVWQWNVWDHLVQEVDATKPNYGVVSDHPELFNINATTDDGAVDFNHFNGLSYDAALDQIIISSRGWSEFYIIDHSTTMAESASHSGGRSGHGGDILYRWGNPQQYHRGTAADKQLFNQHDAHWIPAGYPGAGHVTVFNNGIMRQDGTYSSADEIVVPTPNADGTYDIAPGAPFAPAAATWRYAATPHNAFLSLIISSVERQPNGNTLICEGTKGNLFEVDSAGTIVWRYVNPVTGTGPLDQGQVATGTPVQANAVFKIRRYPPDYPGLVGQDLTPGEPLEHFVPPHPVPDGTLGTTALRATRFDPAGTQVDVTFDATSCPSGDYDLVYGDLADVRTYTTSGSSCLVGTTGATSWTGVPAGNLWFLMIGTTTFPIYESSWGTDSFGVERAGTLPSLQCGITTKSLVATCP
jgi:hypothetical protein